MTKKSNALDIVRAHAIYNTEKRFAEAKERAIANEKKADIAAEVRQAREPKVEVKPAVVEKKVSK